MLIDLKTLCDKYNFIPTGIIHVGAHKGEESEKYESLGINKVVWIEANPKICWQLKHSVRELNENRVINALITDVDDQEVTFNVTNNGESSSVLELEKHKEHHPHIYVSEKMLLKTKTMKTVIEENSININNYNFLNLDVQGAELMVLKGFGNLLENIDYVYTEVNIAKLYKDCALMYEIDEYLNQFKFKRVETNMTTYEWGDAFYKKITE